MTEREKAMDLFDRAPCFNPYHERDNSRCYVCKRPTPGFPEWSGKYDALSAQVAGLSAQLEQAEARVLSRDAVIREKDEALEKSANAVRLVLKECENEEESNLSPGAELELNLIWERADKALAATPQDGVGEALLELERAVRAYSCGKAHSCILVFALARLDAARAKEKGGR